MGGWGQLSRIREVGIYKNQGISQSNLISLKEKLLSLGPDSVVQVRARYPVGGKGCFFECWHFKETR